MTTPPLTPLEKLVEYGAERGWEALHDDVTYRVIFRRVANGRAIRFALYINADQPAIEKAFKAAERELASE